MDKAESYLLFCEDVRDEVGNKSSLMGILGQELHVDVESARMRKLNVVALVRARGASELRAKFVISFDTDKPDVELPKPPQTGEFTLSDEARVDWTNMVVADLSGLPIHVGMRIDASLDLDGHKSSASLIFRAQEQVT